MQPPPLDPLEAEPPLVELVDPTATASRRAVRDVAQRTRLGHDDLDALVTATSEGVTNAIVHGLPPVTVRLWAAPQRMAVTLPDRGQGPQDPYMGLVPQPGRC